MLISSITVKEKGGGASFPAILSLSRGGEEENSRLPLSRKRSLVLRNVKLDDCDQGETCVPDGTAAEPLAGGATSARKKSIQHRGSTSIPSIGKRRENMHATDQRRRGEKGAHLIHVNPLYTIPDRGEKSKASRFHY